MAFEDAVILAKVLRDDGDAESYERLRRPRVERNILRSAELSAALTAEHAERMADVESLRRRYAESPAGEDPAELLDWDAELPPTR